MSMRRKLRTAMVACGAALVLLAYASVQGVSAQGLPVGVLDPNVIPKYVTPLVIPPVMPKSPYVGPGPAAHYNIAVRQFQQQILPGGIWNTLNGRSDNFGPTTVWSYGRAEDPLPDSSALGGGVGIAPAPNSTFNYPAFTVENISGKLTKVRWINDLVDENGNYLPHLFAVDQTLHWANPPASGCSDGDPNRTDCMTMNPEPYTGPVPMVTHVHGAHVNPQSDGYPEAWWLPAANDIPPGYATRGSFYNQFDTRNTTPGSAFFGYENQQPEATLWYHDHALGMTRLNVYAGPAGFWLVRDGVNGWRYIVDSSYGGRGVLPCPAPTLTGGDPNFNLAVRSTIREIPLAIQDRSFWEDGSLFYPDNRAFFEGLNVAGAPTEQFPGAGILDIPFIGDMMTPSDIAPIWNPEAFFNTMVVNGATWPKLDVAPALYRFRLLDGCNSRFLNLALFVVTGPGIDGVMGTADDTLGQELPFYQIGAEEGFLPKVVKIQTGLAVELPGNGTIPATLPDPANPRALLMGPAERADVIVDFRGLANGTVVRMINTGPDGPFGGFPVVQADSGTTGQVMQFVVDNNLRQRSDSRTTRPERLVLPAEAASTAPIMATRSLSLNEEVSSQVCVTTLGDGTIQILPNVFDPGNPGGFNQACATAGGVPFGPKAALLGTADPMAGTATPLRWMDAITENPILGDTEVWEIFNLTMDSHPIHLHLVRFEVIDRQPLMMDMVTGEPMPMPDPNAAVRLPEPTENGYKDTVIANPGEVTRIKAKFDILGRYVWHCHIVEHEDNEMMRPYEVVNAPLP